METRILDDAAELAIVGSVPGTGGTDDIFLNHDAAHVIYAESQADLPNLQTDGQPGHLDILEVVEIYPAECKKTQIFRRCNFWKIALGKLRVLGLEGPGNERREPAGFVLKIAKPLKVADPVMNVFTDPIR